MREARCCHVTEPTKEKEKNWVARLWQRILLQNNGDKQSVCEWARLVGGCRRVGVVLDGLLTTTDHTQKYSHVHIDGCIRSTCHILNILVHTNQKFGFYIHYNVILNAYWEPNGDYDINEVLQRGNKFCILCFRIYLIL